MPKGIVCTAFALLSMGFAFQTAQTARAGPMPIAAPRVADGLVLAGSPLPKANPQRVQAAPNNPVPVEQSAQPLFAGAPRPHPRRAKIVGRVSDGAIVPVAPSAYAASPEGTSAALSAVEAAAGGAALPPASGAPVVASIASVAEPPVALAAHGRRDAEAFSRHGRTRGSLKAALDALKRDDYKQAIARRNGLKDPLDRLIVDYFLVRAGPKELTSAMVLDFAARAKGWATPKMLRNRLEMVLVRENPSPSRAIEALGGKAQSAYGVRLLANAYLAKGDKRRARELVRSMWHNKVMGRSLQKGYTKDFASLLTADDHLTRVDFLIGEERFNEAKALRDRLGKGPRAYLDARIAAATGAADAGRKLKAVPSAQRRRPGYILAQVEVLRRADQYGAAARLIEKVKPSAVVNGDAWWVETRIVSRSLAERGKWRRAQKLAARGYARGSKEKADEAFHAGWFALTGLKDGATADRHFKALLAIAKSPLSRSRAHYWRGRAAAQRGDKGSARAHYTDAAQYGFTYYGQLARAEIGRGGTGVVRAPKPTAADRLAMNKNPMAVAVKRLSAADHKHRIWPLMQRLALTVPTPGQAVIVSGLGEKAGLPHLGLMAAKAAQRRGLKVGQLAYPTKHIPRSARVPAGVDRAVVYAIARQESLFNPVARSPVGAAGLMQVMPRTAASMARELGLKHSKRRLTADPAYNATLGAAYLKKRLGNFSGSYILTFAAYNAGAGRVREWIERFGDPRAKGVDPITWVEQIPYPETRNYVMRVMENVQVYREALGSGRMAINSDLRRGRSS